MNTHTCNKCGTAFLGSGSIPYRRKFADICRLHRGEVPLSELSSAQIAAFVSYEIELNKAVRS
jgi:hypothetical protein